MQKSLASVEAERTALADRVMRLEEETEHLRAENAELRGVAGPGWEAERLENGRLREKLAAIAADVVRMAQAASGTPANGAPPAGAAANDAEEPNGAPHPRPAMRAVESDEPSPQPRPVAGKSLAERIRALQHAGSRH
jgi:hypothetical protein